MRTKEPFDDTLKLSQPGMLKKAVNVLLEDGTILPQQMIQDLKMFPDLIEEVLSLNPGTLVITDKTENNPTLIAKRKFN